MSKKGGLTGREEKVCKDQPHNPLNYTLCHTDKKNLEKPNDFLNLLPHSVSVKVSPEAGTQNIRQCLKTLVYLAKVLRLFNKSLQF
jgi:hypothetical protein